MRRRVVITGVGLINASGNDAETAWKNAVAGRSGITHIERFNAKGMDFPCQVAGEMLLRAKRTLPSHNSRFTPPVWLLLAEVRPLLWLPLPQSHLFAVFGDELAILFGAFNVTAHATMPLPPNVLLERIEQPVRARVTNHFVGSLRPSYFAWLQLRRVAQFRIAATSDKPLSKCRRFRLASLRVQQVRAGIVRVIHADQPQNFGSIRLVEVHQTLISQRPKRRLAGRLDVALQINSRQMALHATARLI